jgi:hypothetical protein
MEQHGKQLPRTFVDKIQTIMRRVGQNGIRAQDCHFSHSQLLQLLVVGAGLILPSGWL